MIRIIEVSSQKNSSTSENQIASKSSSIIKSKIASAFCLAAIITMFILYFQTTNVITLKLLVAGSIIFSLLFIKNQQN